MAPALNWTAARKMTLVIAIAALIVSVIVPNAIRGSSHREAPLISRDPTADNTDLYAFVSPDKPNTVTIIANYIPLEEPAGGPNFNSFDDNVLYEIKVDNNGDARADLTYQFRFKTSIGQSDLFGPSFLYNDFTIDSPTDPDLLLRQSYSVTRVKNGKSTKVGSGVVPPVNVGPRSTPNYEAALATPAIARLSGGVKAFAGQRDDAFFVDLGSIFDLGGLRPFNPAHLAPITPATAGVDGVGGFNTHTISLQIPITQLTRDGKVHALGDREAVIGVWATASRPKVTVLGSGSSSASGPWVQVSRLGNPLINEVIIPLALKDRWNSQAPRGDSQFAKYYTSPALAKIVNTVYPSLPDARTAGRADLAAILLTGLTLPDGTPFTFTGNVQADMLRLNTAVPPCTADAVTDDVGSCSRLGVLDGDLAGFPNGRRLADDVTDIELRAIADGYGPVVNGIFGALTPNNEPNNDVGDGVNVNDRAFLGAFPYQATPHQGYAMGPTDRHHPPGSVNTGPL
jgi:Domain of unknown function (DUF4331)